MLVAVVVIKFDRVMTLQRATRNNDSMKRVITVKWLHAAQEVFILLINRKLLYSICTTVEFGGCD